MGILREYASHALAQGQRSYDVSWLVGAVVMRGDFEVSKGQVYRKAEKPHETIYIVSHTSLAFLDR